jgi:hypothetical protein
LADGSPCKKCGEVIEKIEAANQMRFIDTIVIADEADNNSQGMVLAAKYDVNRAPFFIVEHDNDSIEVFTIYFKLVKEILTPLQESA